MPLSQTGMNAGLQELITKAMKDLISDSINSAALLLTIKVHCSEADIFLERSLGLLDTWRESRIKTFFM